MITSKVFSSPKNAYSKLSGNSLNLSFGDDSDDRLSFFLGDASCFILNFHLLVSIDGDEFNKALTWSTDMSISKFQPKLVKHQQFNRLYFEVV